MKRKIVFLTALLGICYMLGAADLEVVKKKNVALTTLIVVRHAEKNNETDTTTLSPEGYDRANRLAQILVNTNLSGIYATPFIRMHQTAEPTAKQKNLPIQDYVPHEMNEIDRIIETNSGKTVLLVGHGNTIPKLLNHYTGSSLENLSGYNDIFVLNVLDPRVNTNSYLHFFY